MQLEAEARSQGREIAETERFIERFRYKASKARQVQSRVKSLAKLERVELAPESRRAMRLRIPAPARAGDVVLRLEGVHKRYGETVVYRGRRLPAAARRPGRARRPERRGQVDAAADRRRRARLRRGRAHARPQRDGRLLRAAPARDAGRARAACSTSSRASRALDDVPAAARPPGRLPLLGRRRPEEGLGALGRREGAARAGQDAAAPGEFPGARRAHQPPRRGGLRGARRRALRLPGDAALHLARPRLHQRARDARGRGPRRRAARSRGQLRRLRALGGRDAAPGAAPSRRAACRRARLQAGADRGARAGQAALEAAGARAQAAWPRWRRRSRSTRAPSSSSPGGSEIPRCTATATPCARWKPSESELRGRVEALYREWERLAAELESAQGA